MADTDNDPTNGPARDEDFPTWEMAHRELNHAARPVGVFGCPFCCQGAVGQGRPPRPLPGSPPPAVTPTR